MCQIRDTNVQTHTAAGRSREEKMPFFLTGLCAWDLLVSTHSTDTPGLVLRRVTLTLCFLEAIVEDRNIWKLEFPPLLLALSSIYNLPITAPRCQTQWLKRIIASPERAISWFFLWGTVLAACPRGWGFTGRELCWPTSTGNMGTSSTQCSVFNVETWRKRVCSPKANVSLVKKRVWNAPTANS